jgi:hypothetical protein
MLRDIHPQLHPTAVVFADTNCSRLIESLDSEEGVAAIVAVVGISCRREIERFTALRAMTTPLMFSAQGAPGELEPGPFGANVFLGLAPPQPGLRSIAILLAGLQWPRPAVVTSAPLPQDLLEAFARVDLARNIIYNGPLYLDDPCGPAADEAMRAALAARTPLIVVDM